MAAEPGTKSHPQGLPLVPCANLFGGGANNVSRNVMRPAEGSVVPQEDPSDGSFWAYCLG